MTPTEQAVAGDFEKAKTILLLAEADMNKLTRNANDAAGTRLRKAMQELKSLTTTIRVNTQKAKNERKPAK